MEQFEACKKEYAELLVMGGIHLAEGESVIINSDVETSEMARLVAKACYEHGASQVEIRYSDAAADSLHYAYADVEKLKTMRKWEEERLAQQVEDLPCVIYLMAADPQQFTEEMLEKQNQVMLEKLPVIMKYRQQMEDKYKWTIGGVPTAGWAKQVFPEEAEVEAIAHLWRDILKTVMVTGDGTAVSRWNEKWKSAWAHMDALNEQDFRQLHIVTGLGTDLTVTLHEKAEFHAGAYRDAGYAANLPSEELYTTPMSSGTEGVMIASMPLVYQDQYMEGIRLEFHEGKIVSASAEKGAAFLQNLIKMDEGAGMLGEVAIVDKNSPVNQLGHLMYHTLYDENAAGHIAIGRGFNFVFDGFASMTDEEKQDLELNQSAIHCDIMYGTEDTCITGIHSDGSECVIMKDGSWCI